MIDISDGICGYVAGGLGNQLFILAAAWNQARRLDAPLYLDTSFHRVRGTRGYELGRMELPGTVLEGDSPWRSIRLSPLRVVPAPRLRPPVRRRVHLERDGAHYEPSIERVRLGTTLFGYFQSPRYFERVADDMDSLLRSATMTAQGDAALSTVRREPAITVHLRRGDYLDAPEDRRVIAGVDYVIRAGTLLRSLGVAPRFRVFSDSPELVARELDGAGMESEIFDDSGLDPISAVKVMSEGTAMIMSNSTFSWWAAWLMRRREPRAVIIAPRPWDETGTAKADLLGADWISLEVR